MDFEKVKNMIAEQLKVDPAEIKPESRLMEDLKADSANIMVMIMDLEDTFGITVEDDSIKCDFRRSQYHTSCARIYSFAPLSSP